MDVETLIDRYLAAYPGVPPIAHLLRDAVPERWLRIHSLPESRRYPESAEDWDELLKRHRSAADAVIGVDASALMVASYYPDGITPGDLTTRTALPFQPWPVAMPDLEEDVLLLAAPIAYRFERIESLLRMRAADEIGPVLVFGGNGRIYAPYDGGADLFLRDPGEREGFRGFFRPWLSKRPDGL